jgi:hypothetical protein
MCNLYSITTNQAAIIALFRVVIRPASNPTWMGHMEFSELLLGNFRAVCSQHLQRRPNSSSVS